MKFQTAESNGRPHAVFEDEKPPRSWLLSAFLEEARTEHGMKSLLEEIEKGERGIKNAGFTGDHVDVEVHPDRVVIQELWPVGGEAAEPAEIELSLAQAKQLLQDWKKSVDRWYAQRP